MKALIKFAELTGVKPTLLNAVDPETGKPDLLYEKRARASLVKTGSKQGLALQFKQKNIILMIIFFQQL